MRHPSRNNKGGKKSRKKISGSSATLCHDMPAKMAPSAICTRGSGMEKGIARTRYPLATTASSIESTIAMEFTERLCSLDIDTTTVPFTLGGNRADKAFTVHSNMNHG
jgi:hypothetical protein